MMEKPKDVLLLVGVCVLLIVILGAVESGKLAGVKLGSVLPGINFTGGWWDIHRTTLTTVTFTGTGNTGGTSTATTSSDSPVSFGYALPAFLVGVPGWLFASLAAGMFAGIGFLMLRLKTSVHVVDLKETLAEMEIQQKYLAETWSYELRNAALLRYYLLLRKACAKVGLPELPTETPQEYIGRASSFLKVGLTEAGSFADAVNRSRYGEELSREEAGRASKIMEAFTTMIRGKTNAS